MINYNSARASIIIIFIILVLIIIAIIYWAFFREKSEVVLPPAEGVKSITLTLVPTAAIPNSLITPSVDCSPDCNGKNVFIREYSKIPCAGNQVSSCLVSGNNCAGSVFAAPSQPGVHGYVACLDRNGDNNFNGEGESSKSASLVVKSQ